VYPNPSASGYTPVSDLSTIFTITSRGHVITLGFDGKYGALINVSINGRQFSDSSNPLAIFRYDTYSETDMNNMWYNCYSYAPEGISRPPSAGYQRHSVSRLPLNQPIA
jgi:hypothetical protein